MVDQELAKRIVAEVDRGFDAQIAFTQDLVRFPPSGVRSIPPRTSCMTPLPTVA